MISDRSGFILIAVLLMISALAALILEFNYDSRIKLHLAENFSLAAQALNNADAGIAITLKALRQNENIINNENIQPFFSGMVQIQFEDGSCKISIVRESGKININKLCTSEDQPIRLRVEQMLRLIDLMNEQYKDNPPLSYGLVPAIIDWVDSDDDVTILPYVRGQNTGAENNYYEKLVEPFHCKNGPFDVLSELLLVKGISSEVFYGRAGNDDAGIELVAGMNQYLTVYGDGKININEASVTVIRSLSENIGPTLAQNIIEQRKYSRYTSIDQLKNVLGMTGEIYDDIRDLITTKTNESYYIVTCVGMIKEFKRTVQVVLQKNQSTSQWNIVMRSEI
jgi:general secretion pathway protein K